jgi:chemotaxis-related protein WspB
MLHVLFQLGSDWYAVEASRVREVLPLVELKAVPQAPVGVAGVFDYHGEPVPVVDLTHLATGHPSRPRFSTRILLVRMELDGGRSRLLGFAAERATEMLRKEREEFVSPGVHAEGAPYLGDVAPDERGLIQRVEVDKLLPTEVRDALFAALST